MSNNQHILSNGATGSLASFGSFLISILPDIEQWLRIASLMVGIIVGLVTIWIMIKRNRLP